MNHLTHRYVVRGLVLPGSVVLGLAAVVGCTPGGAPSATPTPTVPVCSPLDGSTPYPCTQAEFEDLAAQWALYDEAEGVLRRYVAEVERQESDWRLREMTPELESMTTGAFRSLAQQLIDADRSDEASRVSEPAPIAWVKPVPGQSRAGSLATLRFCIDATREYYITKNAKEPVPGVAAERTYYFVRESGLLKITTSESERVASC